MKQSFRITDYEKVIIIYKTIVIIATMPTFSVLSIIYNYHEVYHAISYVRNPTHISAGGLHETVAQTHTYFYSCMWLTSFYEKQYRS